MTERAAGRLRGEVRVPGDKSVSHRALILGALADGTTEAVGLAPGADVRSTASCLRALGAEVALSGSDARVKGSGTGGLPGALDSLDAGNSGTTMRLLAGVAASHPYETRFTGDESLSRRPMGRVAEPLRLMGARVELTAKGTAPMLVSGGGLRGIEYRLPVPSAQVKSAVLLAGLGARGTTTVVETEPTRDHTERMLEGFGVRVARSGRAVSVAGGAALKAARVEVPGDPSSAAFWAVAATLAPESELSLRGCLANPTRTGYLSVLARMGAKIERAARPSQGGEPVEDLVVRSAKLVGVQVAASEVPSLVDEVPILALAACRARGDSRFRGLAELRHKESDRLAGIADLLCLFGAKARVDGDDLVVEGGAELRPAAVDSKNDHRLAMTAFVAGFLAGGETRIEGASSAEISYPSFYDDFAKRAA